MDEIKFIELFAGIGGFRHGLEQANQESEYRREASTGQNIRYTGDSSLLTARNKGKHPTLNEDNRFICVWANDNDQYACQIYRKRFGKGELYEGDIRTVDPLTIPEHDLLCAGFPCQSFSIAGKRGGFEDTRGTLFFEICRIARAKRTKYLLLENVKGLLSHDEGNTFQTIIRMLDELGYDCQWQVLNSKDFGVPQNRERVFIIGHLRGQPRPKVLPIGEADSVYPEADKRITHAIDSNYHKGCLDNQQRTMVIQAGIRSKGKPRFYEDEIPAMAQAYGTGGGNVPMIFDVYNQTLRANQELAGTLKGEGIADTSLGTALIMRDGRDNRSCLREGRTLELGIKGQSIRRLTPTECERLQGFPDNWTECGIDKNDKQIEISDTQRYKVLGNAVTTTVIMAIGNQLRIAQQLYKQGVIKFKKGEYYQ